MLFILLYAWPDNILLDNLLQVQLHFKWNYTKPFFLSPLCSPTVPEMKPHSGTETEVRTEAYHYIYANSRNL